MRIGEQHKWRLNSNGGLTQSEFIGSTPESGNNSRHNEALRDLHAKLATVDQRLEQMQEDIRRNFGELAVVIDAEQALMYRRGSDSAGASNRT